MNQLLRLIPLLLLVSLTCNIGCNDKNQTTKSNNVEATKPKRTDVKELESAKKTILFFGNSLTAGYGLEEEESFPSLVSNVIDSLGLAYTVVNAGLSGETTSGGLKRIDWVLNQKVDIFVLELGANDMLRGLPVEETRKNLDGILNNVKTKYPNAQLALCEMLAAPNMGKNYAKEFQQLYSDLAKKHDALFIPFFLDGVVGNRALILPDGVHPNAAGQKIVAQNIWESIKLLLVK